MASDEKCEHQGKAWWAGDHGWKCLKCGHEEAYKCQHTGAKEVAGMADHLWCSACGRAVKKVAG